MVTNTWSDVKGIILEKARGKIIRISYDKYMVEGFPNNGNILKIVLKIVGSLLSNEENLKTGLLVPKMILDKWLKCYLQAYFVFLGYAKFSLRSNFQNKF